MRQVLADYKCKARKLGVSFELTVPQFKKIAASPCFYCGAVDSNIHHSPHGTGDYAYNGLDKIDAAKGYTVNNAVSCCKRCNFAKSNLPQGDFIRWIRTAYAHLAKTAMAEQWCSTTQPRVAALRLMETDRVGRCICTPSLHPHRSRCCYS